MKEYLKIKNSDSKIWILPKEHLRMALNIYQPSSKKGILVKKTLPYIEKIRFVSKIFNKILKIKECDYSIDEEVDNTIREKLKIKKEKKLFYSLFLGTPCIDQKTTIQIYDEKNILGYCKLSDKENVIELFNYEKNLLDYFNKLGIKNIPHGIYCGRLKNKLGIFIQDTKKSNNSKIEHSITDKHISFIEQFCNKTEMKCKYQETDYYKLIMSLNDNNYIIKDMGLDLEIIENTIRKVNEYLSKTNKFSAYHGDFTPWNTLINKNEIFVFDFEYAKMSFPQYIDLFHFYTQSLIYKRKLNANDIFNNLQKFSKKKYIQELFGNVLIEYEAYLLSIIAFYLNRDQEKSKENTNIKTWINLLQLIG